MSYEAWRISFQSSEQAARAAYAEVERLKQTIEAFHETKPAADSAGVTPCESLALLTRLHFEDPGQASRNIEAALNSQNNFTKLLKEDE